MWPSTRLQIAGLHARSAPTSIYLQKPKPVTPDGPRDDEPAENDETDESDEYDDLSKAQAKFTEGCDLIIGLDPGRTYPISAFRGEEVTKATGRKKSFCPQISTKE